MPLKVHVTGVTGLIGDVVYAHLAAQPERYEVTGSSRRYERSERVAAEKPLSCPPERYTRADLGDLAAVEQAFAGAEVVVHMGAVPDPSAPFAAIVHSNVVGGYNALEACRRQGVGRIVYASTVMTDWGYQFEEPYKAIREARFDAVPADFHRVTHRDAARPTEPYSASKVWGEGLCRAYADGHGRVVPVPAHRRREQGGRPSGRGRLGALVQPARRRDRDRDGGERASRDALRHLLCRVRQPLPLAGHRAHARRAGLRTRRPRRRPAVGEVRANTRRPLRAILRTGKTTERHDSPGSTEALVATPLS